MKELIVIGYDNAEKAEAARTALLGMSGEYLVDVSDAVVATVNEKGKIKLNQMVNLWAAGAAGGSFWGLLIGLLFLHPLFGVVVGASAGALSGAVSDFGISDPFMRRVTQMLQPGQAALFVMSRTAMSDRAIEELAAMGGEVVRTNLDSTKEQAVRDAFDNAHAELANKEALPA
ncbi:DUF1269 domain-containing protein [Croceicoccus sediminis]|uniref:DUF1269 domain-containing protein n=1 Tax=Croceicoccus sediminis TaxID=2571150 RepID=UPI0011820E16|nr:DUF1269 domain-containing protein [Croceicoccus sediminis]